MATLRYLASASLQSTVADSLGISQSSVSRAVDEVCSALVAEMEQFIKLSNDIEEEKRRFFSIAGFPGVVGVVDGSHVRIMEPKKNPNSYINRKYYPSINVCAVCDSQCKFTYVSIRWPGSCHDSFIFRQTDLWEKYESAERGGIILGDSGYACRKWLMTPYPQGLLQTQQSEAFNKALSRTRVKIECAFGRLKRRFLILHNELRVTPEKATVIIGACMVLHNIAIDLQMPDIGEEPFVDDEVPSIPSNETSSSNGFAMRDHIANTYFSRSS